MHFKTVSIEPDMYEINTITVIFTTQKFYLWAQFSALKLRCVTQMMR